jgi:hypothetical protein
MLAGFEQAVNVDGVEHGVEFAVQRFRNRPWIRRIGGERFDKGSRFRRTSGNGAHGGLLTRKVPDKRQSRSTAGPYDGISSHEWFFLRGDQ